MQQYAAVCVPSTVLHMLPCVLTPTHHMLTRHDATCTPMLLLLQELGDMEPELRGFVMDEYMCKQRHDWPEGLKFPSQCLLSCMRSIRSVASPSRRGQYV